MFSTCLFCHAELGANDSIESFPVGKRLAFDGECGRLWAVCPRCARWNLAPIEERWEALEECEKAYRAATRRVSTDNIVLARISDGTDLIRIGRPLLPEFATWRYGDLVNDRRRRATRMHVGVLTLSLVAGGAVPAAMLAGLDTIVAASALLVAGATSWWSGRRARRPFRAALPGHDALTRRLARHPVRASVRRAHDGEWVIEEGTPLAPWSPLRGTRAPRFRLDGAAARAAMPPLLAAVAPWGGNAVDVKEATDRFQSTPDAEQLFDALATQQWLGSEAHRGSLMFAGTPLRLAFEMALHEEDERRALAGELGALYTRWEEAERVARIADGELTRLAQAE